MKPSRGTKIAAIILGFTISLLAACIKDDAVCSFRVSIRNDYFEQINNVTVGNLNFGSIGMGDSSIGKEIKIGKYSFRALSASGLLFESTVNLRGDKYDVQLRFNSEGKLESL